MKYHLRYLLHQLEHQKRCQVQEQGLVQEWVFPLQKAAQQALEVLERSQAQQGQKEALAKGQPWWSEEERGWWEAQEKAEALGQVSASEEAVARESAYWSPKPEQQ